MKKNKALLALTLFFVFSLSLFASQVFASQPDWIQDEKTGCEIWNTNPLPNESITYSGECKDGKAHGYGEITWYKDGKQNGNKEKSYRYKGFLISKQHKKIYNRVFGEECLELWNKNNIDIRGLPNNRYSAYLGTDDNGIMFFNIFDKTRRNYNSPSDDCIDIRSTGTTVGIINKDNKDLMLDEDSIKKIAKSGATFHRDFKIPYLIEKYGGIPTQQHEIYISFVSGKFLKSPISPKDYSTCRIQSMYSGEIGARGISCKNGYLNYVKEKLAKEKKAEIKLAANKKAHKVGADFVKKNKVEIWPSIESLQVNPFVYENKVIGLKSRFTKMLTATEAIFDDNVIVYGIPKGKFLEKTSVVIAGIVSGNKTIKNPFGGEVSFPNIKYKDVYFCNEWSCNDFLIVNEPR